MSPVLHALAAASGASSVQMRTAARFRAKKTSIPVIGTPLLGAFASGLHCPPRALTRFGRASR
jgi:hypothetical protein